MRQLKIYTFLFKELMVPGYKKQHKIKGGQNRILFVVPDL